MSAPILGWNELDVVCAHHWQQGIGISLATGCFDIIHAGHVRLLREAASYGPLFVGINSDSAIKKLKGQSRPINTASDRALVLSEFMSINAVFEIDRENVAEAIRAVRPKFWVKSSQYSYDTLDKDEVEAANEVGAKIIFAMHIHGHSTTGMLSKI